VVTGIVLHQRASTGTPAPSVSAAHPVNA
jgi:hypothetical protein